MSIITVSIGVFLAVVVGYLVLIVSRYINSRIKQERYDFISKLIEDTVRELDQAGKDMHMCSEQVYADADHFCRMRIESLGLKADDELINSLVGRSIGVVDEKYSVRKVQLFNASYLEGMINEIA